MAKFSRYDPRNKKRNNHKYQSKDKLESKFRTVKPDNRFNSKVLVDVHLGLEPVYEPYIEEVLDD